MAFAMFSMAMRRKPSATSSGLRSSPVASWISFARSANLRRTTSASSAASPLGPKTLGKKSGTTRPSMTLQSVTASGPPRR